MGIRQPLRLINPANFLSSLMEGLNLSWYLPIRRRPIHRKRMMNNVIYFGPGIHKPERIALSSGQTLYIAGGAIVKGGVAISGDNIKIKGRGILCGNDWPWRNGPGSMIRMTEASNVRVEGIILTGILGLDNPHLQ